MGKVYIYVVDRDFGFAPNPFHGYCTLATCKPGIRNGAEVRDWVIGMGGSRLGATGRCVFAMRVTEAISFNQYWTNAAYRDKRPVRNGSRKMMVGDNIYFCDPVTRQWRQADSHHSNADGSLNPHNLATDTQSDKVLLSRHFFYFGKEAPSVPHALLTAIGYKNGRNYRVFDEANCASVISWLHETCAESLNQVSADPFDFAASEKRYSSGDNRIT